MASQEGRSLVALQGPKAAEVLAGDVSKLGKPRSTMPEQHSFLSGLETKVAGVGGSTSPTLPSSKGTDAQLTLLSVLDQLRCTTVRTVEALLTWQRRAASGRCLDTASKRAATTGS